MKEKRINEFKGVILIAIGIVILASLVSFERSDLSFYTSHPNIPSKNLIGRFGAYLAGAILYIFGWAGFIIPVFTVWLGIRFFKNQAPFLRLPKIIGSLLLLLSTSSLIGLIMHRAETIAADRAGIFGFILSKLINRYFGTLGGYILFITLILLSLALVTEVLISTLLNSFSQRISSTVIPFFSGLRSRQKPSSERIFSSRKKQADQQDIKAKMTKEESPEKQEPVKQQPFIKPKVKIKSEPEQAIPDIKPRVQPTKLGEYHLPGLDLLDSPPPFEARQIKEDLTNNARILEETLDDFGIAVKVTDIERGPIITRYELEPAPGVKLNRIVTLSDDIALAMKAQSVRIVAPIPGKARVGVEVPNSQSTFVYIKEVIGSKEFQNSSSKLTISLGKDIAGFPVVGKLDEMPHLLIAGTTGSGKTVCVNSVILSLLMKATPEELKLVMIDPKMVELAPFNGLPHLLCPVVTESKKASAVLQWVVNEMETRYKLLADVGARNIISYNEKQKELMPYIVVLIDEFADLMVVARDQVESAVTRLAQLSRAVGIHIVLATQRPSVDVITGVIKANLPARISFKVASKVDSRTVLDMNGADKLLGRGDMLFLKPQDAKLTRAQGCLVTDQEIERIVDFIKQQAQPVYDEEILKEGQRSAMANGEKDEMYDEAVRIIIETNQPSVSILQRRLRLGYTRAARIIDMMEQEGIVGPFEGSKPRKLLVDREEWLKKDMMQEKSTG